MINMKRLPALIAGTTIISLISGCVFYGETHRSLNASRVAYGSIEVQTPAESSGVGEQSGQKIGSVASAEQQKTVIVDGQRTSTNQLNQATVIESRPSTQSANTSTVDQNWFFEHNGAYTVQYTSVKFEENAKLLANHLTGTMGQPAYVYEVKHNEASYYIVLSGEYAKYQDATEVAAAQDGWVRNTKRLRKNRCDSSVYLESKGHVISPYCADLGIVAGRGS